MDVEPGLEAALALLDAAPGDLGVRLAEADDAEAALRRHPLAALTALAWTLAPVEPRPALREQLMERLTGDETQMVTAGMLLGPLAGGAGATAAAVPGGAVESPDTPAAARPAPAASPRATDPSGPLVGVAPAARRPEPTRRPTPAVPIRPPVRRTWPALAALAAAVIALGGTSVFLWRELGQAREQLQRQAADRQALESRVAELEEVATATAELAALEEQLALVTAPTTELCPMMPPGRGAVAPDARGLLYVAADHQHWYLRALGLEPPGEGRVYHLWFVVGDTPVSAGSFRLEGDEAVLTSPTMPEGTRAAVVTVEPEAGLGERPSGPVVLYGSELARLL
jgi:hypothetical protein